MGCLDFAARFQRLRNSPAIAVFGGALGDYGQVLFVLGGRRLGPGGAVIFRIQHACFHQDTLTHDLGCLGLSVIVRTTLVEDFAITIAFTASICLVRIGAVTRSRTVGEGWLGTEFGK